MGKYEKEKKKVLKAARWLSDHGYFASQRLTGGNVSTIIKNDKRIVISPRDRSCDGLSVDDMRVLDMDIKTAAAAEPHRVEDAMHISVYRQRPDATAVIHTHSVYASVLAVLNKPIPALFDEITYKIGPVVDVVPYAMWDSPSMIERISNKLHNKCFGYILQNHGALCLGSNMQQAMQNAELLERVAQIYYLALISGIEITRLPESSVKQINEMRRQK